MKNMKRFSCRFKKNVALFGLLGICVSCNNNTINKHSQDDIKGRGPKDKDNGNNKNTDKIRRINVIEEEDVFIEEKEKTEDLVCLEKFNEDEGFLVWSEKYQEEVADWDKKRYDDEFKAEIWNNLYFSSSRDFVFEIMPNGEARVFKYGIFARDVVSIPNRVFYRGKSFPVCSIGFWAFAGCRNVKWVYLPSSIRSIENFAFCMCMSLKTVLMQKGVIDIGDRAFCCCENLESINFPEGLLRIGSYAFMDCLKIRFGIVFPEGLKKIGDAAFYNAGVKEVFIPASVDYLGVCSFCGVDFIFLPKNSEISNLGLRVAWDKDRFVNDKSEIFYFQKRENFLRRQERKNGVDSVVGFEKCFICCGDLDDENAWEGFPCKCVSFMHKNCFDAYIDHSIENGYFSCPICGNKYTLFEKYYS